ncbi:hypothetical protein [Paenibacillus sp. FSL H8-0537]|uniref:hypothetical protein n=1 Tax=Paenibacillus sp. FSL H8-0537 TaxID=2921399 RepID=UPI003100F22F
MGNIFIFEPKNQPQRKTTATEPIHFEQEVAQDIARLQNSLFSGNVEVSWEEALNTAKNFYRRYPALIGICKKQQLLTKRRRRCALEEHFSGQV